MSLFATFALPELIKIVLPSLSVPDVFPKKKIIMLTEVHGSDFLLH